MSDRPTPTHRVWECRHEGCGLVLGVMRAGTYGGRYLQLDLSGAAWVEPSTNVTHEWLITCRRGHVTIWRGYEVRWRQAA